MTSLVNDFFKFVRTQPKSRKIDHSNSWDECAVGDYTHKNRLLTNQLLDNLADEQPYIRRVLGLGGKRYLGTTYGELAVFIEDNIDHHED